MTLHFCLLLKPMNKVEQKLSRRQRPGTSWYVLEGAAQEH